MITLRIRAVTYAFTFLLLSSSGSGLAQSNSGPSWFGMELPPGIGDPHSPSVDVTTARPGPVSIPRGEEQFIELEGAKLFTDVEQIISFSRHSRAEGNRVWGRIIGFESAKQTLDWTAARFNEAGLVDVEVQEYPASADMWWPRDWEVKLLGNDSFGRGSRDIVLETSLPTGGSEIAGGKLTAPLILTGHISAGLAGLEVNGKIAVQRLTPLTGAYSERTATRERAQQLMRQGAVAVINVVEQTGNMHTRDFSRCNGPCFNIGTKDGEFLIAAIQQAEQAGLENELRMQLSLDAGMLTGLTGHNAMAIVPGRNGLQGENVIVNAHADGWYDAAGDNADGLAVLLAMARHFAGQENQPPRNIIFVASGGHHSTGLNGPANFVRMNPDILARTVLVLNLEHIAQFEIQSSDWSVGPKEQPMSFSITNSAPFLTELTRSGMNRYGFNLNPKFRTSAPGDLGGYRPLGLPMIQAIHSGPMYHASGDVLDTISKPGLERAARFFTFFVDAVARAEKSALAP